MVLNRIVTVPDVLGKIWKEVAHFKVLCHSFSEGSKSYG
jgi:hypothetical protein